jgi:hypothetical protein
MEGVGLRRFKSVAAVCVVALALGAPAAVDAKTKPTLTLSANGKPLMPGAPLTASSSNFQIRACSPGSCGPPDTTCASSSLTGELASNGHSVDSVTFKESTFTGCQNPVSQEEEVALSHGSTEFKAARKPGRSAVFRIKGVFITTHVLVQKKTCEWQTNRPLEGSISFGEPVTATFTEVKLDHGPFECAHSARLSATFGLFSAGHPVTGA